MKYRLEIEGCGCDPEYCTCSEIFVYDENNKIVWRSDYYDWDDCAVHPERYLPEFRKELEPFGIDTSSDCPYDWVTE